MADDVESTGPESACWTAGLHAQGLGVESRQRLFDLVTEHQDMIEAQLQAAFPEDFDGDLIAVGEPCDQTHGGEQASEVEELKLQVAALKQERDDAVRTVGGYTARYVEMKQERDDAVQRALDAELAVRADLSRYPRPWGYNLCLVAESLVEQVGWDDVLSPVLEPAKEELREQYPDAQIVYRVCAPDELPEDMMVSSRHLRGVRVLVAYAFPPMLNGVDEESV